TSSPCLLTSLSGLAADSLALVADALRLVGVGLAQAADVRGHLAHLLLVDSLDVQQGRLLHPERDALRRLHDDGVAVAQRELQVPALGLDAVAHTRDLEGLGVPLGGALDQVGNQRAGKPVQGTGLRSIVRTRYLYLAVFQGNGDRRRDSVLEFVLRPLDFDVFTVDGDFDALGDRDRLSANTRHAEISPCYQT